MRKRLLVAVLLCVVLGLIPSYVRAYTIGPRGVSEVPTILPGDVVVV